MSEIRITVKCGRCQEPLGHWNGPTTGVIIEEKYPFWCDNCDDYARGFSWP